MERVKPVHLIHPTSPHHFITISFHHPYNSRDYIQIIKRLYSDYEKIIQRL